MSTSVKSYVVGLMFSPSSEEVALIRKSKPAWQRGLLNGVGGKIEQGETPIAAMVREFREETGWQTLAAGWTHFLTMQGPEPSSTGIPGSFVVECFCTVGNLDVLESPEEEKIEIVELRSIWPGRRDMVENLCWMVGLALDVLADGRPEKVNAIYPGA